MTPQYSQNQPQDPSALPSLLMVPLTLVAVTVAAWGFWFDTHANSEGVRAVFYLPLIVIAALADNRRRSLQALLLVSGLCILSYILQPPKLGLEQMRVQSLMAALVIGLPSIMSMLLRRRYRRLDERLYQVAKLDRLTHLHDRHYLLEELDKAIQRWRRGQMQFSAMVVDVDGLSNTNARYGERLGDELLARTAMILRDSCRELDYLGRLGADRFLLILPATEATDAMHLAKRAQQHIGDSLLKADNDEVVSISVSMGIVQFNNGHWSAEDTLCACNAALDASRAKGYGQISVYESDELPAEPASRA
jgi:diguanylate cyclase (GGDEF)-like protein